MEAPSKKMVHQLLAFDHAQARAALTQLADKAQAGVRRLAKAVGEGDRTAVLALAAGAVAVAGLGAALAMRSATRGGKEGGGRTVVVRAGGGRQLAHPPLTAKEKQLEKDFVDPADLDVDFGDIGGLDDQIQEIEELVLLPLTHPHLFKHSRVAQRPTGILLYGPPGTGKTMIAKAIARSACASFLSVNIANIESKWFGETPKMVEAIFSLARKRSPCVIFIDEVDGLLSSRQDADQAHVNTMKTKFMECWDGLTTPAAAGAEDADAVGRNWVLVIGATNKPWALDPAVLRRMPRQIKVSLPEAGGRASILSVLLRHEKVAADVDVAAVAAATEGYSGSDLKELVRAASLIPIREAFRAEQRAQGAGHSSKGTLTPVELAAIEPRPIATADLFAAIKAVKATGQDAMAYRFAQRSAAAAGMAAFGEDGHHHQRRHAAPVAPVAPASPAPSAAAGGVAATTPKGSSPQSVGSSGSTFVSPVATDPYVKEDVVRAVMTMGASTRANSLAVAAAVEHSSGAGAGAGMDTVV